MNNPQDSENIPVSGSPEEMRSALFAHMVMQQSSMAMMLMGKSAHPETGKVACDLEAARFFIDQLEMIEFKTKGNLNQEETALLKQSLMSLRMAFVESADSTKAMRNDIKLCFNKAVSSWLRLPLVLNSIISNWSMKNLAASRSQATLPVSGCADFPISIMAMLDCCMTMCAKSADRISSGLPLTGIFSESWGLFMTHYLDVWPGFRPAKNG